MALGIGITVVNTRLLGPLQYGNLKFLQNLFTFVVSFLTIGIFYSGSRLLAQKENENIKHQIIGNLLIFASAVSIVLSIFLFCFSFFEEGLFNNELGSVIRLFSPLLFVFPFQTCIGKIMQGDNRIYELSVFRLGPKALYLVVVIPFNYLVPLSLTSAIAIQLGCLALLILIMVIRLRPKFENLKNYSLIILKENQAYGIYVYYGFLANVATMKLSGLSIAYFIDNTNVGFYFLALSVTAPLTMISSSLGTTLFKDFANNKAIPQKATAVTLTLSVSALLLFMLMLKRMILILYSIEYIDVVPLAYIISVGSTLRGFGDYINRFLGAHGRGKEIRNVAFANGLSNVIGYTFLIYYLGVIGAAVTSLVSDFIYWFLMYYYYKRYKQSI
jgi:O-antigen/teichoic acid export membrane protein